MNITKEQLALKFHETYERLAPEFGYETRSDTKKFDPESNNGRLMIAVCEAITRGLADAEPVCNHEWFQTGAMLANEKRCIKCGEWGKLYTSPQAALKSELSAQAALARLPSEGKPIEALAPTEAALRDVVRQSEDLGLYDADFQIGAQEREAFEAEFDQLCKDYSIYGLIEARLCKVFFEAGRTGSKP